MELRLILVLTLTAAFVKASQYEAYNDAYMFGYGVYSHENDQEQNFGQKEHRNENEVMGEWYVQLPDGRVQRVRYYVDKYSGFVADVTYEAQVPKYDMDHAYVPRELPSEHNQRFNPFGFWGNQDPIYDELK